MALRCSEPKQPPRLGKVCLAALAVAVHAAETALRLGVALRCSEPVQPPSLGKVYWAALAAAVHVAERALRFCVALFCSKPEPASLGLVVLARVGHGVPDERGRLALERGCACRQASAPALAPSAELAGW